MYKGKFTSELSMNEVKEYYDELRRKYPLTEDQWADFKILQEKLIVFAYKILDAKTTDEEKTVVVNDVLDGIKGYIDHIRNTGMGKKKSLEFIEKYIEGLKAESEGTDADSN